MKGKPNIINDNIKKIIEGSRIVEEENLSQTVRYNYNIELLKISKHVIFGTITLKIFLIIQIKVFCQVKNDIAWNAITITFFGVNFKKGF